MRFAFALAFRLGCTVDELGRRMTALEFEQWRVMYMMEGWGPWADALRHRQLLAAAHNGPLTRRGARKVWTAADLDPGDPWAGPKPKAPPTSGKSVRAQLAAANAARRRGKVH